MLLQGVGDEEQLVLEPERAGVGDALDQEVARVLEGREAVGQRAWGQVVAGAGRLAPEGRVRALVVVEGAEAIERPLLMSQRRPRRPTGSLGRGLLFYAAPGAMFPIHMRGAQPLGLRCSAPHDMISRDFSYTLVRGGQGQIMSTVKSKPGLLNRFHNAPKPVRDYFTHLPGLVESFPLDVALSYVFGQVELAQNMTLYCGIVKLHKADGPLTRSAIDAHHMTRKEFREKFAVVFGSPIPDLVSSTLGKAEGVRDRVMHGKGASNADKRNAVANVIDYAEKLNDHVNGIARFRPFGDLRGFKGAAKALDKSTTRWVLKGMGFPV